MKLFLETQVKTLQGPFSLTASSSLLTHQTISVLTYKLLVYDECLMILFCLMLKKCKGKSQERAVPEQFLIWILIAGGKLQPNLD